MSTSYPPFYCECTPAGGSDVMASTYTGYGTYYPLGVQYSPFWSDIVYTYDCPQPQLTCFPSPSGYRFDELQAAISSQSSSGDGVYITPDGIEFFLMWSLGLILFFGLTGLAIGVIKNLLRS